MLKDFYVILGLGASGLSCARFLYNEGATFAVTDNRVGPAKLADFKTSCPNVPISLGKFDEALINKADILVVSPGISLKEPVVQKAISAGKKIIGDIELFSSKANAPIIAITGTNAKSTVTTLVYEMAKAANVNAVAGGNLGRPALDLLQDENTELFVLELSSFQLDTTYSLRPKVATVLNITPDHMDRYNTFEDYCLAKHRIYSHCDVAVYNRDDPLTDCGNRFLQKKLAFTLDVPLDNEFGLIMQNKETYLAYENKKLLPIEQLPILGQHFQANALAALAIGHGHGLPMDAMLSALLNFKGLAHRCQYIRERNFVRWYNDSKGTNVGATIAAIQGLGNVVQGKLILIAGGLGKNADFSTLLPPIEKYVKAVVLIGEAAPLLAAAIKDRVKVKFAGSMEEAVIVADKETSAGDSVLLSPACASLDMFRNFEHRGDVFMEIVHRLN